MHALRLGTVPSYVDTTRSPHNDIVIRPPAVEAIADAALERRQARYERGDMTRQPRSIRRDGTVAIEGIITFGADAQPVIDALPHDEQARRYRTAAEAIAKEVGTDVAGLVIHRDESAPHAHIVLSGVAPDGSSVARKLTKGKLSKAQDAAAEAFDDLNISRGKKIGARIADGEDPSKYINRTVAELHRDLPDEVAAARQRAQAEREKAEQAEQRRAVAQAKADKADGQVEKLEKRVATYERRATDAEQRAQEAEAEAKRLQQRLEALADTDKAPPKQRQVVVRQVEERGWGPFSWQKVTGTQNLVYLRPSEAKKWRGAVLKRERDAREDAERQRQESERLEKQRRQEASAREKLREALMQMTVGAEPYEPDIGALWATDWPLTQRYGVQIQVGNEIARVPPQEGITDRQIAAALYRTSRGQGWEVCWFSVPPGVAREVIALARDDDRLDRIRFHDSDEAAALLQEARKAQDADPMAAPPGPSQQWPRPRDEFGF